MTAEPITNQEGNQELKNKRFRESPDGNSQNRTDQEPGAKTGSDRSCVAAPRGLQNQSQDKNQIPSMGRVCDLPEGVRAEDLPKPGDRQSGEMENISSVGSTSSPTCSAAAAPPPPFTPSALSAMGREPETETARYFLKKLGSPAHLRGRGKSWDDLAAIVEKQIPPYGMALVLDWIFNPKSDGFWAKQIRQRRKDPFEFFFRHLKQIVDQYNVYLDACERTQHPARQQQPEPELELEQEQWQQEELE